VQRQTSGLIQKTKKGAVPEGRAPDYSNLPEPRLVLVDDVVRHAARKNRPHLSRHLALDFANPNAELEELLHTQVQVCPLITMLVVAGVEERPTTPAGLFELVWELIQHRLDLGLVTFQTSGVKPDVTGDSFGLDVFASVLAVPEQTVREDRIDSLGVQNHGFAHSGFLLQAYDLDLTTSIVYFGIPVKACGARAQRH